MGGKGIIKNCKNSGEVYSKNGTAIGIAVGGTTINKCFNTGKITGCWAAGICRPIYN